MIRRSARSVHRIATLSFVTAFVLLSFAILYLASRVGTDFAFADEKEYFDIATSVERGGGYEIDGEPTAYRPPAWPLLLAITLFLRLPAHYIAIVSAILLIISAVLATVLGRRLVGNSTGAVAGIAVLAYPLNAYTATTLYPQMLATALLLTMWLVASLAADKGRDRLPTYLSAILGFAAALLALAVPTMAATAAMVLIWVWWIQRGSRLRFAIVAGACLVIPIAVWVIRNDLQTGTPTVLSTSSGVNLLIGNNASATGDSGVGVDITQYTEQASHLHSEAAMNDYYTQSALEWMEANPRDAIVLYGQKFANYFSPYNSPTTITEGEIAKKLVSWVTFSIVVALTITRVALRRLIPIRPTEKLFLAIFLANAFIMAIFFTRTRFRQPLDNILVIEAAVAVAAIGLFITNRRLASRARKCRAGVGGRDWQGRTSVASSNVHDPLTLQPSARTRATENQVTGPTKPPDQSRKCDT